MSRRYDFAMQRHGKGKKRKNRLSLKEIDLQPMSLFKDPRESEYEASWKKDLFSPDDMGEKEDERGYSAVEEDLPLAVHAVGIGEQNPNYFGQEFSGITDRISKLLHDYESLYDDKDQQGFAAMQEHLSGQMAMDSLLTDYKSLCREREELLNSLQDSLEVDEEEILNEMENLTRKEHQSVDSEGAQKAIRETFQNVNDTKDKLKAMNKKMIELLKKGEATEELESEKRQLEKELQMYKKMAVQQRKDIFNRRSSIRRDEVQQWKLVAGEMVDMLKMVRNEGNLDKDLLEKELNRILMTLNTQTEYIDNLKIELSKQDKSVKNLERDKSRLNNDKLLVEDELKAKQQELKQCKQYLRKVMSEKKDLVDKIKIDLGEIDLTELPDEGKLGVPGEDMATTSILQAQVRDARKVVFRLEEENKELQKKLASLQGSKETEAAPIASTEQSSVVEDRKVEIIVKECPKCSSYESQVVNISEELKKREAYIERLKEEMNKLRAQLHISKKEISYVKSELALAEAEVKKEEAETASAIKVTVETAPTPPTQESSEQETVSGEEEVEEKAEKASKLTVPTKKPKQRAIKSPRKRKKALKAKEEDKQEKEEEEEMKEDKVVEEEDKTKTKTSKKKEDKGTGFKRKTRDLVVGECREEKAPYVTVREARMVTLADKGTQTSHYDRKATEGITQRDAIGRQPQHRGRSLAEFIMTGAEPSIVEQETNAAMMFIKEEADRLCDAISGFVEYGFDIVQQGAKTTRLLTEAHLGENAMEMLESEDHSSQMDSAKALKALMSGDHRRQSITASKKRRPSVYLERRGSIRRDSKLPLLGSINKELEAESVTEQKADDAFVTDQQNSADMTEQEAATALLDRANIVKALMSGDPRRQSITASKKHRPSIHLERRGMIRRDSKIPLLDSIGKELEAESATETKDEGTGVTDQHDTAVTTEQGPPTARVNSLFPDQQTAGDDRDSQVTQAQKEVEEVPGTEADLSSQSLSLLSQVPAEAADIFNPAFIKKTHWSTLRNFGLSLQLLKGGGCSHVVNEVKTIAEGTGPISPQDQIRELVTVVGQHAIDTIQSTAQMLRHQLREELSVYGRFYKLRTREKQGPTLHIHDPDRKDDVPVVGKKILTRVDERDSEVIKTEESALFPPITPQMSAFQPGGRTSIATAGMSHGGMMMIQGAGPKPTEAIPPSTSQNKMKKRGKVKNYSRKQLLLKQKALVDNMLHVKARVEDLQTAYNGMGGQHVTGASGVTSRNNNQIYTKQSQAIYQGIPQAMSQDFYSPLMARSVALPTLPQGLQIQGVVDHHPVKQVTEKKRGDLIREDENIQEPLQLPGTKNVIWQRKNSIARYPSQKAIRKSFSEHQTKLPLLSINHILKVGQ